MEKKLSDYLHLYLGCNWQWTQYAGTHSSGIYGTDYFNSFLLREKALENGKAKPILRPLSDMTLVEARESCMYARDAEALRKIHTTVGTEIINPALFVWLLSKHFDLFGLIEAGLAIDATLNTAQVSDTTAVQ